MRLKANIRCLMQVSPPDSAAMAVWNLRIPLLPAGFVERGQAERSRGPAADRSEQNEVICRRAATDTCVVLCASVVVRPHITGRQRRDVFQFRSGRLKIASVLFLRALSFKCWPLRNYNCGLSRRVWSLVIVFR